MDRVAVWKSRRPLPANPGKSQSGNAKALSFWALEEFELRASRTNHRIPNNAVGSLEPDAELWALSSCAERRSP